MNSNSLGVFGTTSGAISIKPQAASGTWNFNLPTTAGTVGQLLTSQAGGSNAMTWTTVAGTGTVTSVGLTVPSFLSVTPATITTSGTFAVTLSGNALPINMGASTAPGFTYTNTATGSANTITALASSLATGNFANIVIGRANSTNNAALFGFNNVGGAGSNTNTASIGLVGSANSWTIDGLGKVVQTTTSVNFPVNTILNPSLVAGNFTSTQLGYDTANNNGIITAFNLTGVGSVLNNASFNINGQGHSMDIYVPVQSTTHQNGSVVVKNGGLGVEGNITCNGSISTNTGTDRFTYSEGSWTPVVSFVTTGSLNFPPLGGYTTTGITDTGSTASYVKVGKMVTVAFKCKFNYGSNSASTIAVGGLPFPPSNDACGYAGAYCQIGGLANNPTVLLFLAYPTYMFIGNNHGDDVFSTQVGGASGQVFIGQYTYKST